MHIRHHALLSFPLVLAATLNPWFLISAICSILIDADHYLYYMVRFNSTNLGKAYNWYIKERQHVFNVLHTIWFWLFLFTVYRLTSGILSNLALFIVIGFIYHSIFDFLVEFARFDHDTFKKINHKLRLGLDKTKFSPKKIWSNISLRFLGFKLFPKVHR